MVAKLSKAAFTGTIFFVICFCPIRTFAQGNETYFCVIDTTLTQVSIPPYLTSQIVIWSKSAAKSIPLYFLNWNIDSVPAVLPPIRTENQVMEAGGVWSSASNNVFGFTVAASPGVYVAFSKDGGYFPPGRNDVAGMTYNAVEYSTDASRDLFAINTNNPETDPSTTPQYTIVVFNNTSVFTNEYVWDIDTTSVPSGEFCFMQVALHELGHVIGLGDDGYVTKIYDAGSVMGSTSDGTDFHGLSSEDNSALNNVKTQTLTGLGGGGPSGPPAPTGFSVSIVGQDVVLSWDPDPIGSESTYSVTKAYNGTFTVISPPNYSSTTFTDQGAVNNLPPANTPSAYYVTASNSYGSNSAPSITVCLAPSSGNISPWSGVLYVNSSITIPWDSPLTIEAGTKVVFNAGHNYSLATSSPLYINGLSYNPVTFTSSSPSPSAGDWGVIALSNSGANGSNINYANIQYGTEVYATGANNVTIQNCNITNNSGHGIYFYESTGSSATGNTIANSNVNHGIYALASTVNCYSNTIYKTNQNQQGAGIFYSGSSGTIGENDVDYYNWGIAAIWGSSPNADQYPATKNNRVTHCQLGLNIYYQSYCDFGNPPAIAYIGNSIYGNLPYNVAVGYSYPTVASGLYACGDWWGSYPRNSSLFYVSSACYGDFDPANQTDPWLSFPLPSVQTKGGVKGNVLASVVSTEPPQSPNIVDPSTSDSLIEGIQLRASGKFSEAKDFFLSYLNRHPDAQAAYVYLYSCADSETMPSIIQYFESLPVQAAKAHKLLLSYLYLRSGDVNSAKLINSGIIDANPNTPLAERAKLNNFYIALYNDNEPNRAALILKDVEQNASLSTSTEINDAEHAFSVYVDPKTGKMPNFQGSQSMSQAVSQANGLVQNYPNPFNPTTVINYNLHASGHVTLKVYDVLGREVMTLVDGYQNVGVHSASFDGSNLSSGIYFYRITAPGINQVKKMILIK